jgi:sugar O-acyltransferase (sialic acid O-acetyltransferase NeuD family)
MNALFIYCAGGFGKEIIDIARRINDKKKSWREIIFIDDFCSTGFHYGARVFSFDMACEWLSCNSSEVLIANGEPAHRSQIRKKLDNHGIQLGNYLIDDSAIISLSANINNGVLISPYCSISSNSILDENCSINTMSIVGHDVNIGENVVISSMVNLGGNVRIGKNSYVGMGALIKEKVNIGENVIIGMSAVVYNDIPNNVIALGNPARVIRTNEDGKVFR